jgi:hypothetical protein
MDLVIALHVLLAGIGTALLARRLGAGALGAALAGAALMACGYVASIAPNKVFVGTAWMPWVAWAADRAATAPEGGRERLRAAAILAAVLGVQHLAGDPASSITSGLVALAVVLARAPRRIPALAWLLGASAAALLLAAASVLPGLALLPHTSRASLSLSESGTWSLHPWRLLELVWPGVLGSPVDPRTNLAPLLAHAGGASLEPSWSFSLYLGAPVLGLAALPALRGRRDARGLWIGAALLIGLALGAYTPLHAAFRGLFPPERITRYPEKHVAGALVILCALAGAGAAELARARARTAAAALGGALLCLAVPLAVLAALGPSLAEGLRAAGSFLAPSLDPSAAVRASLRSGAASLAVAAAASALLLLSARPGLGRIAGPAAILIVVGQAAWEGWAVSPVASAERLSRPPALLRALLPPPGQAPGPPPRVARSTALDAAVPPGLQGAYRHETLFQDSVGRFGFAAVPGFEGWRSRDLAALWPRAQGMPLQAFLSLLSIDYVALPRELAPRLLGAGDREPALLAELELGFASEEPAGDGTFGFTLAPSRSIRPRAFVAPRWRWAAAPDAVAALLAPGRPADPGLVVLTGAGPPGGGDRLPLSPCRIEAYRPERIAIRCASPAGGYAVLAEENAPGWTAAVDGEPAAVSSADVLLRAVPIPPGSHRVELRYRTPLLRVGAAISALAWLAWLGLLARTRPPRAAAPMLPGS